MSLVSLHVSKFPLIRTPGRLDKAHPNSLILTSSPLWKPYLWMVTLGITIKTSTYEFWKGAQLSPLHYWYTICPLHINLQGGNLHSIYIRHKWNCSLPPDSYCWRSFSCIISLPLPPPVNNSCCLFPRCQPLCVTYCTGLRYFSRYYTVRFKMFPLFSVFVFYVLLMWKVLETLITVWCSWLC